ncbi:PREDICTED: C5a anaphylatoxin chemotactic receptor 1 [Cyprinodon variegatus]|uniref:Zgc:194202 n=1 Tax=Cyprinodon variegatus TaxID=28743 RepID=A0A3Q2CJH7_CYPVA|nr:PREDICTED: C5a anaphylatoxin chemotactic receptor 1 [Cyprinodon variegatus]
MNQPNFTVAPSYFSTPQDPSPPSWTSRVLIPAVVLSFCFILGVPGNIAVILLKPNWQKMSSLSRQLMCNLAVSDLLCLMTLPPWIYNLIYSWPFGMGICKLLTGLVYCSVYGSMLTVTAVSVQRYVVVVHRRNCKQVPGRLILVLLWLVAVLISIPSLVVRRLVTDQKVTYCRPEYSSDAQRVALLLIEATVGLASISLVAFAYVSLQRRVSQGALFKNHQTTQIVTSIIACFFVLWVPYQALNLLGVAAICLKNDFLLKFCKTTWNITGALAFVNSCINPLLYAFCIICLKKHHGQQDSINPQTPDISASATS